MTQWQKMTERVPSSFGSQSMMKIQGARIHKVEKGKVTIEAPLLPSTLQQQRAMSMQDWLFRLETVPQDILHLLCCRKTRKSWQQKSKLTCWLLLKVNCCEQKAGSWNTGNDWSSLLQRFIPLKMGKRNWSPSCKEQWFLFRWSLKMPKKFWMIINDNPGESTSV